jgi:hypothetical protein
MRHELNPAKAAPVALRVAIEKYGSQREPSCLNSTGTELISFCCFV